MLPLIARFSSQFRAQRWLQRWIQRRMLSRCPSLSAMGTLVAILLFWFFLPVPEGAGQDVAATPVVEVIPFTVPAASTLSSRKQSYSLAVGTGDWMDTGIVVVRGDHLEITSTGALTTSDGKSLPPDGVVRGWRDLVRAYPSNSANGGALIGKIGTSEAVVPFLIGASNSLDITSSGEFFLRANLSSDLTATGKFKVTLKLRAAAPRSESATPDLKMLLNQALFATVPRRVQDLQGNPGDMVNFALIGNEQQVQAAFAAAGWVQVDKTTQDAAVHGLIATLSHQSYTQMPMSMLYLFGRSQDFSFARAEPFEVAAIRHHLRVWKTEQVIAGQPLWVGSATHDNGFERDQRTGGVTHHIDPAIDEERGFLEESFANAGVLAAAAYVLPSDPLLTARTATGGSFHSDGRILVMDLN